MMIIVDNSYNYDVNGFDYYHKHYFDSDDDDNNDDDDVYITCMSC